MRAVMTRIALALALAGCFRMAQAQPGDASPAGAASASAPAASAPTEQPPLEVSATANGSISLDVAQDSPVLARFEGSPGLTERLRQSLLERGFALAEDAGAARTTIVIKGDFALSGGPKFYKGVKAPIGDSAESALKQAKERGITAVDVVATAVDARALTHSLSNFTRSLAASSIANVLGDATGMRGWFNTKVAGDPRGFCLSRCEDWNKVDQKVYLTISAERAGGAAQTVRVLGKAFSETVSPEQVLMKSVDQALTVITVTGGPK